MAAEYSWWDDYVARTTAQESATRMEATMIAATGINLEDDPYAKAPINRWMTVEDRTDDGEDLVEFAGRVCYQSFHRSNPETAATRDYIRKNILGKGHESVLEHGSATFYITGVSRSLTHELIRHRHLSVSELSQRFVDMENGSLVMPPAVRDGMNDTDEEWVDLWSGYAGAYTSDTATLTDLGLSRKRAREAARWSLPNATETRIVVTGNHRAWRHVLMLRGSEHADAEIRELAVELYRQLSGLAPSIYSDIEAQTLSDGREVLTRVG